MERKEVEIKLTEIFRKVFNNDSIILSNELTTNDIDHWNSLINMILITEIENSFSLKFKLKELYKMRNVGDIIDDIISKL